MELLRRTGSTFLDDSAVSSYARIRLTDQPPHRYRPPFRRLRVYAVAPGPGSELDRWLEKVITLKTRWEGDLTPGPVGEYVEVVDFDPDSDCFYPPVDLNSPVVLAQDGIPPAEGDPRFHQQTVYAIVMATLANFEEGLGRRVQWSPHRSEEDPEPTDRFVHRLRVYPHAFRGPNAFYSPSKKALLLGYFAADLPQLAENSLRANVFTCLSPGTVAHETTHAVLDGLGRCVVPSDCGTEELAVQEGLADAVGLFQQFAFPGFLAGQLIFTTDLDRNEQMLGDLASRVAQAAGMQAELRIGIAARDKSKQLPDPRIPKYQDRAATLVAALFEGFLAISRKRVARLLGLAELGAGDRRDLTIDRLDAVAASTAKSASDMLRMCTRAIDYLPPLDVTCGDFLRALITADTDLVQEDEEGLRLAVVNGFRRLGIFPWEMYAMSPPDLIWPAPATRIALGGLLRLEHGPASDRRTEFERERTRCQALQAKWYDGVKADLAADAFREMGLAMGSAAPRTIVHDANGAAVISVDSFSMSRRGGGRGEPRSDWVIRISQRRRAYFDPNTQKAQDDSADAIPADFMFHGGCTLLVDAASLKARYCIAKDILSLDRLARRRESPQIRLSDSEATGQKQEKEAEEPFFLLRRGLAGFG